MKKSTKVKSQTNNSTKAIFVGMVLVFIFSMLAITTVFSRQFSLQDEKINNLRYDLTQAKNEVDSNKEALRPSLIAANNTLAFPEFKISVPYDDTSKTLLYSAATYKAMDLRVTSNLVGDDPAMAQLSCQTLVRLNMDSGTPYSPWEQYAGEVKLSDGRTLYIFKGIAFENNEATNVYCPTSSWQAINPDQVVEVFKQAQAY